MTKETDKMAKVLCNTRSKSQYVYGLIQIFYSGHEENLGLYSKLICANEEKVKEENKYINHCQYTVRKMRVIK